MHKLFLESSGVSTDTRKVIPGNIFFALKGENFDANEFAAEAIRKGASYAVVDQQLGPEGEKFIKVNDALQTLQQLSNFHRKFLGIPIIALTGSNGKTTTKELINAVLSRKYRTTATVGNLNNHIGVPLTLLSMTRETEIGIVEMGANHQKEIEFLANLAEPDYGYITNFGKAHLEGFGGVEGVVKGKKELYAYLREHQKKLFLNLDDPLQKEEAQYHNTFTFGQDREADVQIKYLQKETFAAIGIHQKVISGKIIGIYNSRNMAAAYAIGRHFEVDEGEIKIGLENYTPNNNRSQLLQKEGITIILDAYNANPTSMAAAIQNILSMERSPKNAILGDMFELGVSAKEEHQNIVELLEKGKFRHVYLVGENFYRTESGTRIRKFRSFEDFKSEFNKTEIEDSVTLIKGSRGMALERVVELL